MNTTYIFRVEVKTLPESHHIEADNIQEAFERANKLFDERYGEGEYEIVAIFSAHARVKEKLASYRRTAWIPVVEDGDGPVDASKFSGKPWLSKDMEWPVCPQCNKPMRFFVQLDLADLPKDLKEDFGTGLLQMFYCTNCYEMGPFAESAITRIIQPDGEGKDVEIPEIEDLFPPKLITGWESRDDYPDVEEYNLGEIDVDLDDDEWDILIDLHYSGDKLWGWPLWVQSAAYPHCTVCDRRMRVVFQIDGSGDNLPYTFGDGGRGWITQCPEHKRQLTYHFDCY